jgi:hypothetical protein
MDRRGRLIVLLLATPFAIWSVFALLNPSEVDEDTALDNAVFARQSVEPLTQYTNIQRYSIAPENLAAFDQGFTALMARKPQIITCSYEISGKDGTYSHEFWYGTSAPEGYRELTRLVPQGHPLRLLGVGAITACPNTRGQAWRTLAKFQDALPPAAAFHRSS